MKILSITAGAANMYCGSCLRDNALAAELMRQGHDVILLPLYTPTRTDTRNVSGGRVFFGGISVYLEQKSRLFGALPKALDWLWDRPSVIRMFAGRGVDVDPASLGALTVSILEGRDGRQRKELESLVEWLRREPAPPDIIALPYTLLISLAQPMREATGRPVVCSLQGEELFLEGLVGDWRARAIDLIRRQVRHVDAFIATSRASADHMSRYLSIPRDRIHVVPLGIDLTGLAPGGRAQGVVGFLGRIAPEKGLHVLADAYKILRDHVGPIRLEAAGWMGAQNRAYLESIQDKFRRWGIPDEFRYRGEVTREEKVRFLQSLDVFSMPATYDEPKGLPILEAMACGVPVVQPRRGSFPEMLEATGGGILVEPDSAEALAAGLESVVADPALARRLGRAGHDAVQARFGIERMARDTIAVYKAVQDNVLQGSPNQHLAGRPA
jgi:glycosyltransferase involved in cell wall biosynthesis